MARPKRTAAAAAQTAPRRPGQQRLRRQQRLRVQQRLRQQKMLKRQMSPRLKKQ